MQFNMTFGPYVEKMAPAAIETVSGRCVNALEPDPDTLHICDMAWSLSRQARFNGHTLGEPYSVAQHAVFVTTLIIYAHDDEHTMLSDSLNDWLVRKSLFHVMDTPSTSLLLHALCHDNTEAYLVDIPSPIKRCTEIQAPYKEIEQRFQVAIENALDLPVRTDYDNAIIEWADLMALQIEGASMMASRTRNWGFPMPMFDLGMMSLMPEVLPWREAYNEYLMSYDDLVNHSEA